MPRDSTGRRVIERGGAGRRSVRVAKTGAARRCDGGERATAGLDPALSLVYRQDRPGIPPRSHRRRAGRMQTCAVGASLTRDVAIRSGRGLRSKPNEPQYGKLHLSSSLRVASRRSAPWRVTREPPRDALVAADGHQDPSCSPSGSPTPRRATTCEWFSGTRPVRRCKDGANDVSCEL